jgi:4-oxalocrotonate tautomerase
MTFVKITAVEDIFTVEQKQQMMKGITDVVVAVQGEKMRPIIWVVFEDVKGGEWAIGGNFIGPAEVKAVRSGAVSLREAIGA